MNGRFFYRAPCKWNSWCIKEKKHCFVVGDVKVIIFVGTKLNGLSYYGIMDNHLIKCMCVLWKQDVGWGGGAHTLIVILDFQFIDYYLDNTTLDFPTQFMLPCYTLITPHKLYGKVSNTHIVVTWMQVVYCYMCPHIIQLWYSIHKFKWIFVTYIVTCIF